MNNTFEQMRQAQPQFFSNAEVRISASMREQIVELISAIESVIALPAYQSWALARAPEIARLPAKASGVFYGYDFHLTEEGPRLIEINTNAGGGLLNVYLLAGRGRAEAGERLRQEFVAMFLEEWRLERGDTPLKRIAIVDENPCEQFLAPEFELFRQLFAENGIDAVVADPADFTRLGNQLLHDGKPIDMIYNRLTDFSLDATVNAEIRSVFEAGGVVLTPNPRAHALYADKRNLMQLSDEAALLEMGVPEATCQILLKGIPRTVTVKPEDGERFWAERKRWFFKPPAGFGSRAAYRGDKLTKRVFEEILHGGYIAQEIVPPSEHKVVVEEEEQLMKADLRAYVYQAQVQLLAARLYQGQTTNFRTPGGGFAPVFVD
ncbi:MAG: hypothetical protein RLZZ298_2494 [Pseudomonadota bacterium]|jgi:hypothetical protein